MPTGPSAHTIDYTCRSGQQSSIVLTLPDPRLLADVLNPIDVCQYDDGLVEVSLQARCSAGGSRTPARISAVDGLLPPSTAETVCG